VAPQPAEFLNPRFIIESAPHIMVTQFAASVPMNELRTPVADLSGEHFIILRALDMLLTGV
jgi:toxin CcdB